MPRGADSRKRAQKNWFRAKTAARKAVRRAERESAADSEVTTASIDTPFSWSEQPDIPTVTEDNLLAFQTAHFGDDTRPDTFFIDPEHALNFAEEEEEDGGLGWYPDGVKRTLTDDQITMLRQSEIAELIRHQRAAMTDTGEDENETGLNGTDHAGTPMSDDSSVEGDLVGLAQSLPPRAANPRQTSPAPRSEEKSSNEYAQRKSREKRVSRDKTPKRKWEAFTESEDPVHGLITHRRAARELDEQKTETFDMDY